MAEENTKKCPVCGAEGYKEPELSEDIKEDYLISMLGETPFSRVYDFMDGKLSMYIRSMSPEISTLHKNVLRKILTAANKYKIEFSLDPTALGFTLMVAAMVYRVEFNINEDTKELIDVDGISLLEELNKDSWDNLSAEEVQQSIDKVLNKISTDLIPGKSIPMALLQMAVGKHNILEQDLIRACADPNFIKGTGR